MGIVTMTSREEFEANLGNPNYWVEPFYPGHEAGRISHSPACPHYRKETHGEEVGPGYDDCIKSYNDPRRETIVDTNTGVYGTNKAGQSGYFAGECRGPFEPLYMKRTCVGLVLGEGEHNGYDDSDFYAIVWSEEKGRPVEVTYASTRGWTYPNHCVVDATPEVIAKYQAWQEAQRVAAQKAREEKERLMVRRGKQVEVYKGRKVPVGTKGEVIWMGAGNFGWRVGVKDSSGTVHWTAASNVRVVP